MLLIKGSAFAAVRGPPLGTIIKNLTNWLINNVDEYFGFLRTEFNYYGPFEYNTGQEMGCYYTNGKIVLYIGYDSSYNVEIKKFKKEIEDLRTGHLHLRDLDCQFSSHNLLNLISNTEDFYSKYPNSDDQINVYSKTLRENLEILNGDFRKFSKRYMIIQKLKSLMGIF